MLLSFKLVKTAWKRLLRSHMASVLEEITASLHSDGLAANSAPYGLSCSTSALTLILTTNSMLKVINGTLLFSTVARLPLSKPCIQKPTNIGLTAQQHIQSTSARCSTPPSLKPVRFRNAHKHAMIWPFRYRPDGLALRPLFRNLSRKIFCPTLKRAGFSTTKTAFG